ncbi:arginyltransferase [Rhodopirellula sp. JC740]|uniref:Aspartate/glutamate leucyltransferase n=1 Tax=Rhodopirellula halodulae TaxID=2894198 RepID=A0ABS8NHX4_9BACT|nr:arginyltransferase [Rhodopirellula sp. JC740]MCC9642418.1 arginyltransferase [Rhodopirellula sp. JC740]
MKNPSHEFPKRAESVRSRLVLVQDSISDCPYIDGEPARMPLYFPTQPRYSEDIDALLAAGFRRSSQFLYHTACPTCDACQPTRVKAEEFELSKSFRRVLKRAERELSWTWQQPRVDAERVRLYNEHRDTRGLTDGRQISAQDYETFLITSCWPTFELEIRYQGELVGISIMDVGEHSISAVYTHFDPAMSKFSLGTFAVLQQIQWARENHRTWVYLGLYVEQNRHLNYKSRFTPQERLIDGHWRRFME